MKAIKHNTVSVIIPNYNGRKLLAQYIPYTITALNHCKTIEASEIIVVDDASQDDSVEYIKKIFPQIILLQNEHNCGFSKTVNKGLRQARYEAVCILNTDIELSPDFFEVTLPMLKAEDVFGVYCSLKDPNTNRIIEGKKKAVIKKHKLNYIDCLGDDEKGESMYLCGGNSLIDKKKILELGGYDERFSPFYYEDMDLSLRARKKGWKSLYTNRTFCKHQHAATIGKFFSKDEIKEIFLRNQVLINLRHLAGWDKFCYSIKACFHLLKEVILQKKYRPYQKAFSVLRQGNNGTK